MTWHQGPRELDKLNSLASIVARLVRVSLYQKIASGDALLKSKGSPLELGPTYKRHAIVERAKISTDKPGETPQMVSVEETGGW